MNLTCSARERQLDDYLDGALAPDERRALEQHLRHCPSCDAALAGARNLRRATDALPRAIAPARDLWPEVASRLAGEPRTRRSYAKNLYSLLPWAVAAGVTLVLVLWLRREEPGPEPAWSVAALEGAPRLGATAFTGERAWRVGQWLETDAASRVRLAVGHIGQVELEPNSRLQLLGTAMDDHRVALTRGTMHALVWAPPRLFVVETPSATAIDLGCAYTLSVDDRGGSVLEVAAGYVALEHAGRTAIVPAGMRCRTNHARGPGTPHSVSASAVLLESLERFDENPAVPGALSQVIAHARETDGVMLWHLFQRAPADQRGMVFDQLAAFVPPPAGVTREGMVAGDPGMLARWGDVLGLAVGLAP